MNMAEVVIKFQMDTESDLVRQKQILSEKAISDYINALLSGIKIVKDEPEDLSVQQ